MSDLTELPGYPADLLRRVAEAGMNTPYQGTLDDDEWAARLLDNLGDLWQRGRWWSVIAPDGTLCCETSNEAEARAAVRPGDKLHHQEILILRRSVREA